MSQQLLETPLKNLIKNVVSHKLAKISDRKSRKIEKLSLSMNKKVSLSLTTTKMSAVFKVVGGASAELNKTQEAYKTPMKKAILSSEKTQTIHHMSSMALQQTE